VKHAESLLFQQICERPWDVGLRLQFADWMDEHPDWSLSQNGRTVSGGLSQQSGQVHGLERKIEFRQWAALIRYQCRTPTDTINHFNAQYLYDLFDDVGEFDPFASDLLTGLPQAEGLSWTGANFKMGFVHNVGFSSPEAFARHASSAFSSTPIDTVSLEKLSPDGLSWFVSSEYLERLECLALFGDFADIGTIQLAECTRLHRLKSLMIMEHGCGDDGAIALANSENLNQLEYLYFYDHRITDRGALALAGSARLPNVISLSLGQLPRFDDRTVGKLKQRFQYLDGWPTGSVQS